MARGKEDAGPSVVPWIVGATGVISAMLVYQGIVTGEWRGVAITEVQILAVAIATHVGLR